MAKRPPKTRNDPTRDRLLNAALAQFALHGIRSVSLRTITAAAGAANQSAVHYHFRNKSGLVRAILEQVNEQLAPLQSEALAELNAIAASRPPTVREIVGIGFSPYVQLFQASSDGRMAMRLFSRLTWESGPSGQELLVKFVRPYFLQLEPMFRAALPGKPDGALTVHMYLAVNLLIHGLTDISMIGRESLYGIDELYRKRPGDLLRYFYDFVGAGLSSPVE